mmetsp:Transcript_37965/g.107257  ORF Transcript_37965/g.107257 Transcript_37965/m.107257 type:complete len:145 (+) Transcript_37965:168-602(+)
MSGPFRAFLRRGCKVPGLLRTEASDGLEVWPRTAGVRHATSDGAGSGKLSGWEQVLEATMADHACRKKLVGDLQRMAILYQDHPPIETINELLRQCSNAPDQMENVAMMVELISASGVQPDANTYVQLAANYSYFPRPGSNAPG